MAYEQITCEQRGKVSLITLNRPEKLNAWTPKMMAEMRHAMDAAVAEPSVFSIVVAANGRAFCAGADIGDVFAKRVEQQDAGETNTDAQRAGAGSWVDYLRTLPKPTIAAVQGYCIFAGWIVASASDVIFAADDALFLPTNFQYFSVPWDLHPRKAKEILFESRFIGAREAEELGFVNRVLPRAELESEAMAYATRVAENDPFQLRMIKLAINQAQDAQGFTPHIYGAHALYMLSSTGESDPGYALTKPDGKRRPMVQRAFENYERHRQQRASSAASTGFAER